MSPLSRLNGAREITLRPGRLLWPLAAVAGLAALRRWRQEEADLQGQVVLITGGSRGLGLAMAREFADEGCRLVICARDPAELARAQEDLEARGAEVLALVCDVTQEAQVQQMVQRANQLMGGVDILVNNAGIIQVGPVEAMAVSDFRDAMDIMFWGVLYCTLAVLPQMLERDSGRIVNITSIGGRVSVPHLLPYGAAKFAAVGFSEGLRAELTGTGITVTTIVPGLMRTGGHLQALIKGQQEKEYTWMALSSSLPGISMSATRAAKQIVTATRRGEAERVLSLPASILALSHGMWTGPVVNTVGVVGHVVQPPPDGASPDQPARRGLVVQETMPAARRKIVKTLTILGRRAAVHLNQS